MVGRSMMNGRMSRRRSFFAETKQRGEHALQNLTSLPLPDRIQPDVFPHMDEYKAPMSLADLSVELESRGKDEEFQNKTETYAHANDDWLPNYLRNLVKAGKLTMSKDGGYLTAEGYKPPRGEQN